MERQPPLFSLFSLLPGGIIQATFKKKSLLLLESHHPEP